MTKKRQSRSRRTARAPQGDQQREKSMMKELLSFQRQQVRFGAPTTPDIMYPLIKQHTYSVSVAYTIGSLNVGTTSTAGAYSFTLNSLPSVAAFSGCFDRYKVLEWNIQFNPVSQATYPSSGPLYTAIDYDDANTPTSEIAQRDTALAVPIGVYFERTLAPRLALSAYSGAFTSFANASGAATWIDVASPGTQFYGIKFFSTTTNATAVSVYTVSARVHLIFKNNF